MKREYLEEMGADELEGYAKALGVDVSAKRGAKSKIDLIEQRRERIGKLTVLGMEVSIPVKRLHDKNITDRLDGSAASDDEYFSVLGQILGDEQMQALLDRCTDEDGTVDNDALGYAFVRILQSDELKNF